MMQRCAPHDINWWEKNLRPYESALSFAARYCAMNGINSRTFFQFLPSYRMLVSDKAWLEAVHRDAKRIREDPDLLATCFRNSTSHDLSGLAYRTENVSGIRLCAKCAAMGFHSYLHDLRFIERCPWHDEIIEFHEFAYRTRDALIKGSIGLFKSLCKDWPLTASIFINADKGRRVLEELHKLSRREVRRQRASLWNSEPLGSLLAYDDRMSLAGAFSSASFSVLTKKCMERRLFRCSITETRFPIPDTWLQEDVFDAEKIAFRYEMFRSFLRPSKPKYTVALEVQRIGAELTALSETCSCRWQWSLTFEPCWIAVREGGVPFRNRCLHMRLYDIHKRLWGFMDSTTEFYNQALRTPLNMLGSAARQLFAEGALIHASGLPLPDVYDVKQRLVDIWGELEWNPDWPGAEIFTAMVLTEVRAFRAKYTRWILDVSNGRNPNLIPQTPFRFRVYRERKELILEVCVDPALMPENGDFSALRGQTEADLTSSIVS